MEREELIKYLEAQAFWIEHLVGEIKAGKNPEDTESYVWVALEVPELKEEVVKVAKTA